MNWSLLKGEAEVQEATITTRASWRVNLESLPACVVCATHSIDGAQKDISQASQLFIAPISHQPLRLNMQGRGGAPNSVKIFSVVR